ncbi:type III secretion system inner membrane ring lipoprotein SctJ [uncultured Tateyamaria sp.]|uniref:type III secretion system inner membrane ring lipoprotein SctJ n=1 Tax=uncultured Tateyamaria sp. TaxID=455651 RepID=UPI00260AB43B|nr:type III secretion inner membrane ring lipoprotein SctJ [uncultured Tateyamaria sp.]
MRVRFFLLCALLVLTGCKTVLYSDLAESEANKMISILEKQGIFASKEASKDGVNILVAEAHFGRAVEHLEAAGLPSQKFTSVDEVFASEGIVVTPLQERAKLSFAKSQELANAISDMTGIVTAHVQIADASGDGSGETSEGTMVSVMVKVNEEIVSSAIVPKIKEMVVFAVPNASYDRIGVVTSPVRQPQGDIEFDRSFGINVLQDSSGSLKTLVYFALVSSALLVVTIIGTLGYFIFVRSKRRMVDN